MTGGGGGGALVGMYHMTLDSLKMTYVDCHKHEPVFAETVCIALHGVL